MEASTPILAHTQDANSAAPSSLTRSRAQRRRLLSVLTLLTICLFAFQSHHLAASERQPEAGKKPTKTVLKVVVNGVKVTLTATVTPSAATGIVAFYDEKAPGKTFTLLGDLKLNKGVAKGSGDAPPGAYSFKAVYKGLGVYAPSTSNIVTAEVK